MRYQWRAGVALVTLVMCAASARAHERTPEDDMRAELDRLRRLVEKQAERIDDLEAGRGDSERNLDDAVARYVDSLKSDDGSELRIMSRTKKGSLFKLYGFVRADAIHNDSRAAFDNQVIGWALSEDPTAPVGVGAGGDDKGDFTIHPRLSRIGVDLDGGRISRLGDAQVTGKIEVDFYGGGSQSRSQLRMRKAYVNLAWENFSLLAGQTTDLISPLYTSVNADLAMWGAGNLGDRRPQIRGTYTHAMGDGKLSIAGMLGQTGADDGQNLDGPGTFGANISDGQKSDKPTFQGRVGYRETLDGLGAIEIGLWGHRAWEDPDSRIGTTAQPELQSEGWGIDAQIPLIEDRLWLKGEWFSGRNLDDVRGGIFQGVNTTTGKEIHTDGGWVELGLRANDWMTWYAGVSQDDPHNNDVGTGGRAKNEVWWVSTRMNFDPVEIGVEYLNWETRYVGFDKGDLQRVAAYIAYSF